MILHKEGRATVGIATIVCLTLSTSLWLIIGVCMLTIISIIALLVILAICIYFFRFPISRKINELPGVLAPADGKIVVIEEVEECEYFKDTRLQISVFMSLSNIHANWAPVQGRVKYFKYHDGKFMIALRPKSSTENERATTVIEMEDGTEVLVRQIAGAVARRIVTYPGEGDNLKRGDELGFIKFGSRVDLLLPPDSKVHVKLHEKVSGGQTVLVSLKP